MQRRNFLQGLVSVPVAGKFLFDKVQVVEPVSDQPILLPNKELAMPESQPLVIATKMPPKQVTPFRMRLVRADFEVRMDSAIGYSDFGRHERWNYPSTTYVRIEGIMEEGEGSAFLSPRYGDVVDVYFTEVKK